MNDNRTIKILIILLAGVLLLALFGVNNSYGILRWEVACIMLVLTLISLSTKRYYWGVVFVIFGLWFNPIYPLALSKIEWRISDILLISALAYWFWDYFNNYHKGLLFERFIRDSFPEQNWIIINYTKDLHKRLQRFVESDANPDFVFREKATGKIFAVECKYRSSYVMGKFGDEGILWKKDQGQRYLRYSKQENIPVYIAIGVGGNPTSPLIVAFIPIEVIQKQYFHFIPKKVMEQYPLRRINS